MNFRRRDLLCAVLAAPLLSQERNDGNPYPPRLEGARQELYKLIGDIRLNVWIYMPDGQQASDTCAGIVFFFGGGWSSGSPGQFEQQCKYLASRGMVAMTADYRVASRHQVKIVDCVRDAKSAVRWVRANAARLGIDPNRIAASGGSAGGHLAAATGIIEGLEEPGENLKISSKPGALILFNPVLILAAAPDAGVSLGEVAKFEDRFGGTPESISPYHHVKKGAPPAIIFHGKSDATVPYGTAEAFTKKMRAAGNRCELEGYEGQMHGFFNYGRGGNEYYEKTLKRMDEFLVGLEYLKRS